MPQGAEACALTIFIIYPTVEQTKEGITVKPKTAAEVAEIVNPYTDEKEVVVEKEVIAD